MLRLRIVSAFVWYSTNAAIKDAEDQATVRNIEGKWRIDMQSATAEINYHRSMPYDQFNSANLSGALWSQQNCHQPVSLRLQAYSLNAHVLIKSLQPSEDDPNVRRGDDTTRT